MAERMRAALMAGVLTALSFSGAWGQHTDFDRSGLVDFDDFYAFADAFGSWYGDGVYDLQYDLNEDGRIDFDDYFSFADEIGQVVVPDYVLSGHLVHTQQPSYVNIMFQVHDGDGWGVDYLSAESFRVWEDGLRVSPTESAMQIRQRHEMPYRLKTVLMLDNGLSSGNDLGEISSAAASLVENITTQQQIALYKFSQRAELIQDFTDDVDSLRRAISHIQLGYPSTDLYGSVIDGVSQWDDSYSISGVEQGCLILLTDGTDTQGSSTLSEALTARGSKRVIVIGLGDGVDAAALSQLGNAGYYQLDNVGQLAPRLRAIQRDITLGANSLYWLFYMSPLLGDETHSLELTIEDNTRSSTLAGSINSADFYSVDRGVYIDPTEGNKGGTRVLNLASGDTASVHAVTYLGANPPQYNWISGSGSVVVMAGGDGQAAGRVIAVGNSGQTTAIELEDTANSLSRHIIVHIVGTTRFPLLGNATMDFVWIDPGTFTMGASDIAQPEHEVTISKGYWLGKYEITQGQWEAVMGNNPSTYEGSSRPVENVSWNDLQEFTLRLNEVAGEGVYRLPTEAEWEYACRAGTATQWSFGDDHEHLSVFAWYADNSGTAGTRNVGTRLQNPWQAHDLHGNVSEWVLDWFGVYAAEAQVDPMGPASGSLRVIRGGSFSHNSSYLRSAARLHLTPAYRHRSIGARLVRTR